MSNPEKPTIRYYDASEEEAERAYELSQKSGRSIDAIYGEMGIKPIDADSIDELSTPEKSPITGMHVERLGRAALLLDALKNYSKSTSVGGFVATAEKEESIGIDNLTPAERERAVTNRYGKKQQYYIARGGIQARRAGDAKFKKAWGVAQMVEAGADPKIVDEIAQKDADAFYDRYTGKHNRSDREKYRRVLAKQIKQLTP